MPTKTAWKKWEQDMKKWVIELCKWQKENPDKDWLQEYGTSDAGPGTNPSDPPPPPPIPR